MIEELSGVVKNLVENTDQAVNALQETCKTIQSDISLIEKLKEHVRALLSYPLFEDCKLLINRTSNPTPRFWQAT